MGTLDGKVAIVTGAGRGLGRSYAVGLGREGARVVVVGRRPGPADNPETLEHTVGLIAAEKGKALAVKCDIRDPQDVRRMVEQAAEWGGGIDVLVNNAGMYYAENFTETTPEQWEETLGGYLTGPFQCIKAVLPHMVRRGGGSIINLGSNAATSENPTAFAYGVVRAALVRFTVKLAAELKSHNVAVNSLGPGFVQTERVLQVLGRDFDYSRATQPEESVAALLYLAAQDASTFTGQLVESKDFGTAWPSAAAASG